MSLHTCIPCYYTVHTERPRGKFLRITSVRGEFAGFYRRAIDNSPYKRIDGLYDKLKFVPQSRYRAAKGSYDSFRTGRALPAATRR